MSRAEAINNKFGGNWEIKDQFTLKSVEYFTARDLDQKIFSDERYVFKKNLGGIFYVALETDFVRWCVSMDYKIPKCMGVFL